VNLGSPPKVVWPLLARAFCKRKRFVAALACIREARSAGVPESEMMEEIREIEAVLGTALTAWRGIVVSGSSRS
jgi:pentatricopeptide repeat protein